MIEAVEDPPITELLKKNESIADGLDRYQVEGSGTCG